MTPTLIQLLTGCRAASPVALLPALGVWATEPRPTGGVPAPAPLLPETARPLLA
jgi:hypothetical protein